MFSTDDTIVAVATAPGRASIGVVRISGREASAVASKLLGRARPLTPRRATLARVRDLVDGGGERQTNGPRDLDRVVVTLFTAPASYTGEDVVEVAAHGSPVLLERIVASAVRAGARLARPGEFTLRAFLSGKVDLVQAEAVADLIDAVTPAQARLAFDQLEGTITRGIAGIEGRLFELVVRLEASLDFPEEGYHFVVPGEVADAIDGIIEEIDRWLSTARAGRVLREGRQVAIVGRTNVGKSSIFNALVGTDRAIVTEVAGTTRDLIAERRDLAGIPVTFVDTAGLRQTAEPIEREGQARARAAASVASLLIVVVNRACALDAEDWAFIRELEPQRPRIVVANKSDLAPAWSASVLGAAGVEAIEVSARTGAGVQDLEGRIVRGLLDGEDLRDTSGLSNVRHVDLLARAREALRRAAARSREGASEEFVLADIQHATDALGEVTGRRSSDEVLHAIFSRFCIGK